MKLYKKSTLNKYEINLKRYMQFLSVQGFSKSSQEILSSLAKNNKVVLTNNGKPSALMIYADESNLEDI